MRLSVLFAIAGTLLVAVAPAQARSGPPAVLSNVSITSAPDGPFAATGSAICSHGQTATTARTVLRPLDDGVDLLVGKTLTCDDGSGTFDMLLYVQIRFVADGFTDNFAWAITGGTGSYTGLRGFGSGVGTVADGELTDHYTGWAASR
jgi:hypothetical protein